MASDEKQCSQCREFLPLSGHYFDADRKSEDGFRAECKQCRAEVRKIVEDRRINERIKMLDETALTYLAKIDVETHREVPVVRDLATELLYVFNGTRGFAQHVLGTYLAAAPGSTTRMRILQTLMTIFDKANADGISPLEGMTEDELQGELARRLKQTGLRIVHQEGDNASA